MSDGARESIQSLEMPLEPMDEVQTKEKEFHTAENGVVYLQFNEVAEQQETPRVLSGREGRLEQARLRRRKESTLQVEKPKQIAFTDDPLATYLSEIGQYRMLEKPEVKEKARLVQAGLWAQGLPETDPILQEVIDNGKEAKQELINANLRLVVSIAKRYQKSGRRMSDLIQLGNLGLEHAVDKFDPERGFTIATYATYWIKQKLGRGIKQDGIIRQPDHFVNDVNKVADYKAEGYSDEEIQKSLKMGEQKYREVAKYAGLTVLHYDAPISRGDGTTTLQDVLPGASDEREQEFAENTAKQEQFRNELAKILEPQDIRILELDTGMGTGLPLTQRDIGAHPDIDMSAALVGVRLKRMRATLNHPAAYKHLRTSFPGLGDEQEWKLNAACAEEDAKIMTHRRYNREKNNPETKKELARIINQCGSCAVRQQCAVTRREVEAVAGVWAGVLLKTRMQRQKA